MMLMLMHLDEIIIITVSFLIDLMILLTAFLWIQIHLMVYGKPKYFIQTHNILVNITFFNTYTIFSYSSFLQNKCGDIRIDPARIDR